jgi:Protein of unknown function (DUF2911)
MNIRKVVPIFALLLASAIMPLVLRADVENQATKFTFSQAVQIPGRVLPAGTYWFQLADTNNREVVRIFAADHLTPIATLFTVSRQRHDGNDAVAVTLAHRGPDQPEAIVAWYFLDDTEGHEFLYPKQQARELARAVQKTVVASGD